MTPCNVYRSHKKTETYLYMAVDLSFSDLPEELQLTFGEPVFVMQLELSSRRKLARVDVVTVIDNLAEHGYFLQLPPKLPVEEEIARRLC